MAASMQGVVRILSRAIPVLQTIRHTQRIHGGKWNQFIIPGLQPKLTMSSHTSSENGDAVEVLEAVSRYKDRPWDYLESEEYIERYGSKPVWSDYRRNHKGGIPPQKTRKTCIRGDKICGNPCPICRDPNIIIHYQNVNLLQQFISPYTGIVYDPTRTGVCMKQQKLLVKAIETAKDYGLISFQLPHVDFSGEDYSNSHGAVSHTPPRPTLGPNEPWYPWYGSIEPDERELARVKKTYKAYLKQVPN
ncbi:small ribosomal subunit protein mS40 [Chanos chanos]|uniref:Small ribosomal subunit protein mS40 n=1 Tax=Chanos chanos TaxID=29144 RepID=A0A6J2WJS1_CHACN|nr:28S ribosomal protein S18b, mitochondrial [Chanos chanos]